MMALFTNNTILLGHQTNGAHPWPSCNSSLTIGSVIGLWLSPLPVAIKPSNEAVSQRGRHCRSKALTLPGVSARSLFDKRTPKLKANAEEHEQRKRQEKDDDDEGDYRVLTSVRSSYNDIMILETVESRVLLLDSSYNVHSILYKHKKWTDSYWDEFASLPPIVPKGSIAILGLGGGTAAHLMLHLWPELQLEGWEIDQILIDKARDYFGLSDLEKHTDAGGALKVTTWLKVKKWLMPSGRIMVNCGGTSGGSEVEPKCASSNGSLVQNSTIKALSEAFDGQICWKRLAKENGENHLALTGPLPDLDLWSTMVPDPLSISVKQWKQYGDS